MKKEEEEEKETPSGYILTILSLGHFLFSIYFQAFSFSQL